VQSRYGFLVLFLILVTGIAMALAGGEGVFAGASGRASKPPSSSVDPQQTAMGSQEAPTAPLPTHEPDRTAAAVAIPGAPQVGADQLLVQIVDGATGEPVADAEVAAEDPKFRWDRLSAKEIREYHRLVDPFESAKRWGQTAKSDAQGFAVLARKGSYSVHALKDARYGQLQVQGTPPASGWKVKLEPDQGMDVQVVDAAGKGLPEVPVGLTAEWISPGAATGDQNQWVAGYTDEQGFARLRHVQMLQRDWQERKPKDLRAYVAALGLTSVFAPVTPACPVGPVVVLKVQSHGSVRVKMTDRKQQPVPDSLGISLSLGADLPTQHPWDSMGMSEQVVGGIAEFRYVGLGITFNTSTWFNGVSIGKEFAGPRVPGETAEATLSLSDAKVAHLHGRLVQADGKPIAFADASMLDAAATDPFAWFHAKEDGSFDWVGDAESMAAMRNLMIIVHGHDDEDGGEGRMPSASSAPIPMPAALEDVALGDVVVTALKPLARGKVVAWTTPVPKHSLHIEVWQPGDGANEGSWNYSTSYGVAQQQDGSFVVSALATVQPGRMRLSCSCEDAEPVTPFEFSAGQQDLRVELKRSAKLTVRVLLDADVRKHVRLTGHLAGAGAELESWAQEGDDAHVLEFSSLRAGDYQLQLKASDLTVATIHNLHLVPGGATDPRVDPIDLRGQLHSVQLRLVNAAGTVVDHWGQLRIRDARTGAWMESGYLEHGVVNFGVLGTTLDLVVTGAEFRPIRWQGPPGRVDLRIEEPFAVEIELAGLPADLPAESPLFCASSMIGGSDLLRELGITGDFLNGHDYGVPQKGILHRTCLEAGHYEVQLRWRVENGEDESLFTGKCDLSPQQTRVRLVLPDEVQRRIRELLKKK
jgi:hypothetical protein